MKVKLLIYFLLGILFFFITNKKLSEGFLKEYIFDININNIYLREIPIRNLQESISFDIDTNYALRFPSDRNYNYSNKNNVIKNTEYKIDEFKNIHIKLDLDNYNDNFIKETFFEGKNTIFIGKKYVLNLSSVPNSSTDIPPPNTLITEEKNLNLLYNIEDEDFENKGTLENPFLLVVDNTDPNKTYVIDYNTIQSNSDLSNTQISQNLFIELDFIDSMYSILSPVPFKDDYIPTTIDKININNIENERFIISKIVNINNSDSGEEWLNNFLTITIEFNNFIQDLYVNKDDIKKYIYFNFIKNITQ